jgi:hypothetical protein
MRRLLVLPSGRYRTTPTTTTIFGKNDDSQDFDFKEFDIEDILSEAEDALKIAESSLEKQNSSTVGASTTTKRSTSTKSSAMQYPPATTSTTSSPRPTIALDAERLKNTVATTMGGVLFGSILGSIATFQFPDLASALDDGDIFILPLVGAISLGAVGAMGGSQDSAVGKVTRGILGAPILRLVTSLQSAVARRVQKTADDIQALPQSIADAAQQRVQSSVASAVEGVTSLPRKARDRVVQSGVQAAESVKSSVASAVEEVTSIPRQAVDTVKSLLPKANEESSSGIRDSRVDVWLALVVVVPTLIALAFLFLDALATGRVLPTNSL